MPDAKQWNGCTCGRYMTRFKPKNGSWTTWVWVVKLCRLHPQQNPDEASTRML